ncbi:MAG: DNA-directed RNA polymerase subunit delta [Mycoplasmataceae bacterium]|jgi:DNA-directed RNA polymerase subunit delta|nr:DNA-directed RNA polymerase subunit delta [Mycoplasmataceae bacterium]
MTKRNLIEIAYTYAKANVGKGEFSFKDAWGWVSKEADLSIDLKKELISQFYTDLLQDPRFVYAGQNKWLLRDYLTRKEQADLSNKLYDFEEITEDEKESKNAVQSIDSITEVEAEDDFSNGDEENPKHNKKPLEGFEEVDDEEIIPE